MDDWENKLFELYCVQKLSGYQIAKILKCSKSKVYVLLKEAGIVSRPFKEACAHINSGKNNPMYGRSGDQCPTFGKKRLDWKLKGENHPNFGKRGSEMGNWKPPEERRTTAYNAIRSSKRYAAWRFEIFQRDNFCCVMCGDSRGGNLNADHIKQFALIIKENKISNLEEAFQCEELWNISNGRTLCEKCHILTNTFGKRIK